MVIEIDRGSCIGTIYYNGKANVMVIDSVFVKEEFRGIGLEAVTSIYAIYFGRDLAIACGTSGWRINNDGTVA